MNAEGRIRKRIPKSCKRCHRRKQRCVGYPTCTGCESAKQPCQRSESVPSWHYAMSKGALVRRIEVLEAQLSATQQQIAQDVDEPSEQLPTGAKVQTHESRPEIVSLMALGLEGNEGLTYLGPSSGMSIAEDLGRLVQNGAWLRSIPIYGSHQQTPTANENTRSTTAMQQKPRADSTDAGQFMLLMVYAVGAAILQMTETYDSTPPSAFVATALQLEPTRNSQTHASVEAIMLLVLYHLRTSSASRVWYLIGLAMRICIDLGLHRESQYRKMRPYEGQMRRRLFWSVYLVERYAAWSLGRPFSIPEEDIDVHFPADLDDSCTSDELVEQALHSLLDLHQPVHGSMRRFIALTQLQRIMSQIHTRIYRTDRNISTLVPETVPLMATLEDFQRSLPLLASDEADFVHMHWHNSVRMLIQRFVGILPREDPLIARCLYASGQMCQCFKRLRQRDSGYSFLLVNSLYMAGLTICLCLFRAPQLWTVGVTNDLRACSSVLIVMAERNANLKKYRDGLETIIHRVMEYVNDAANSQSVWMVVKSVTTGQTDSNTPPAEINAGQTTAGDSQFSKEWLDLQCPFPLIEGLRSGQENCQAGPADISNPWNAFSDIFPEDLWSNDLFSMDMPGGLNLWFPAE
ncbi:Zn(II)2Cys6 transcription factor [Aspergillus ibericus CBS 121593]|uniref:Zn(II)2Cys6 transcription factor n=1 Tax=Aspergillus ibericus CBS 121593 TaxID=1448316 RepID=A0A395GKS4_9EURO|nr:Zn(II)2Cys6 transcription factor [Aspergillus ibericus CBS 121593]RAK95984.1 Zn(II)2Cys6 transcription factor [Aspergillus ibericus CBS 121593]